MINRHSLVWRIALPYAALLLLTVGGLWAYLSIYVRDSYLQDRRENLYIETRIVADQAANELNQGAPYTSLQAKSKYYAQIMGARVTIVLTDGTVISDTSADPAQMENHLGRPELRTALVDGIPASERRYSDTIQTWLLYTAVPIRADGKVIAAARLSIPLDNVDITIGAISRAGLGASLLTAVLVILLAIAITNYTILPLSQLTETAQKMINGEISGAELPVRKDEIGQLSLAFHAMAARLNLQIQELKTERSKLEAVLANMTDGILIANAAGQVELINPAAEKMFGISRQEALGTSLINVLRHHQLVELWRKSQMTREQQTTTLETSPERLFVQGIATPLSGDMDTNTLLIFQDLTRLRRLEMVRRDFVSNVSHELRTPLASLKALTETLQEGALEDPPAARRFLLRMDNEIDTLTQMVQELLELSRIESGKVPLRRQRLTACELLQPAVERMQVQAERAGLTLTMECPEVMPNVNADLDRIEQVLVNLLHNAIKFTPPGGRITVSARAEAPFVIFSVRDTGVGIPDENLSRIFERFYKVDRARSTRGTGLGLSIARHLVEAHGGRIWAESTPGEGSTFHFSLPIF